MIFKDGDANYFIHYVTANDTQLTLRINRDTYMGDKSKNIRVPPGEDGTQSFENILSVIDKVIQHTFSPRSAANYKRAEWITISVKLYQLPDGMFLNLKH